MINLLLGAPGGGKSYEAVAYHIIPALAQGRKVITNLPLIVDAFPPEQRVLLDIRTRTSKPKPEVDWAKAEALYKRFGFAHREKKYNPYAFANPEDYGVPTYIEELDKTLYFDPWRHPETGAGPLYVIDEAHKPLYKNGTPQEVEEWFAEHRHGLCDVLLLSQGHGKLNGAIKELVQVCYKVRKATALGFSNRYIRKVIDGLAGAEMNESVREYDSAFFKYYKSHTQSTGAGKELEANDIVPIWKNWTFKAAVVFIPLGVIGLIWAGNPMDQRDLVAKHGKKNVTTVTTVTPRSSSAAEAAPPQARASMSTPIAANPVTENVIESKPSAHPLQGMGVHIGGYITSPKKSMFLFTISQNGQGVYSMNEFEMSEAGYKVLRKSDCVAQVEFENTKFYAVCDAPRIGINPGANLPKSS